MDVDFRIIRDVNNIGRFAGWSDVQAISDIESATVYYQNASIEDSGYYRASYEFEEGGTYIGIVTARLPSEEVRHNAVFIFKWVVRLGNHPFFILLLLLCQGCYWYYNGGYERYRERREYS